MWWVVSFSSHSQLYSGVWTRNDTNRNFQVRVTYEISRVKARSKYPLPYAGYQRKSLTLGRTTGIDECRVECEYAVHLEQMNMVDESPTWYRCVYTNICEAPLVPSGVFELCGSPWAISWFRFQPDAIPYFSMGETTRVEIGSSLTLAQSSNVWFILVIALYHIPVIIERQLRAKLGWGAPKPKI